MMTDIPENVSMVPIARIEVLNSRDRNMKVFEEIVESIQLIGLTPELSALGKELTGLSSSSALPLIVAVLVASALLVLLIALGMFARSLAEAQVRGCPHLPELAAPFASPNPP